MSSFLSISENQQLTDGSQNIYVRNCRIKNIDSSAIVKTTSNNTLIGVQEITIGEVSGLQTALNNTLSATMNQTLNMNGFNITNANNITGQAGNSTITISDENISLNGSTSVIIGTSTGFVRLIAFDTILTTTGTNAVQCLRGLNMSSNALTNVTGITMTGASRQILSPALNGAYCVSSFNLSNNNIINVNTISGVVGNTTLTMSNENINIQGGVTTNIGTATGSATISALNTILTTTGTNAVQCLKELDMKTNNINNVNNLLVSEITCSNITGTVIMNSDFNLGTTHNIYNVNDFTANTIETLGNIYLYKSISPNIYVNASLMRQTAQISYNGIALTPAGGNTFQFAPSFIPTATANNISGVAFIPANTMTVGNTFKLTCYGTIQEGTVGITQNFRLYALNTSTISAIQLISITNTETVTIVSRWRLDIVFQIRTIGASASMVINGDLAIGNTNQSITNTTINFDSTAGQQLIGTIYYDTNNSSNNFTTDITSLRTL